MHRKGQNCLILLNVSHWQTFVSTLRSFVNKKNKTLDQSAFSLQFDLPSTLIGSLTIFTSDRAESKIDKFSKITNWVKLKNKQHHSKLQLNSLMPMNGHTLGFYPLNQKLENVLYYPRFHLGS